MSAEKKAEHLTEKAKGKVKEATGAVTGNDSKRAQGKGEQAKADVKQAGEHAKDAFRH
ncbi:CsbD family protein [Streptomyces mashuensis]|uniref:CsbD family protein n=1 Tax=Streptomyces mashuensis TaxID=33904 RepID=A0A919B6T7_9ACTN|nr:CsbD family protein [Streptomyces mashuensis]GHF55138.1 CsbD family protein [Streptomyces mashuensis]